MSKRQQLERGMLAPFTRKPRQAFPLAEVIPRYAAWRAEYYRGIWDSNTAQAEPYRAWFLSRDAGLRAFATYQAGMALRPFAKGDSDTISADHYVEAVVREQIRQNGLSTLSTAKPDFFDWDDFLKYKRRYDPSFFIRLGQWLTKGKDLDDLCADSRIMLYATMYDRAPIPLQFCSDNFAAGWINILTQADDWPGSRKETNDMAVRKWRRRLNLRLAEPLIYRFANGTDRSQPPNLQAARLHGLPFNPEASTGWRPGDLPRT